MFRLGLDLGGSIFLFSAMLDASENIDDIPSLHQSSNHYKRELDLDAVSPDLIRIRCHSLCVYIRINLISIYFHVSKNHRARPGLLT